MRLSPKITLLFLLLTLLLAPGFGCKFLSADVKEAMQPVTLVYWRAWDSPDNFSDIIASYNALHPYVNIQYKKFRYEEYEKAIIEALAEDRGPDIFSLHNTWLKEYQNKLLPLPPEITLPFQREKTSLGFKKEIIIDLETTASITPKSIKNNFLETVYDDIVFNNQIYGLPLAVDTMVLYYNKKLLDNANIPEPPQNWEEFQKDVVALTTQDKQGNIIQSGAALGTGKNVTRATDILSLLMMQNGVQMSSGNYATFQTIPEGVKATEPPGIGALKFYTDFSSPAKEVYTWNQEMPDSLEAFIAGQTAFFFGYAYHLPVIRARAPKLNFSLTNMPQITGNKEVNFANYWIETVSAKTAHPNEAWDFIQFAAQAEQVMSYLDRANKPTALRSLIKTQEEDDDMDVFASQLLTAKSWYHGRDAEAMEQFFTEMIDQVVTGEKTPQEAIIFATQKINQTY